MAPCLVWIRYGKIFRQPTPCCLPWMLEAQRSFDGLTALTLITISNDYVEGLVAFGSEFTGRLWLEVMLIAGFNDDEASLKDLAAAIERISPNEVHLVLPTRPPAEPWVCPSGEEGIALAQEILGRAAPILHPLKEYGDFSAGGESDPSVAAAAILLRHPMSDKELREFFQHCGVADAESAISALQTAGKAVEIVRGGAKFWRSP